jgi:FemAB-related protein (PEP-CTERM system-associated)
MEVRELGGKGSSREWDDFVHRCPEATFFHLSGWREVIATSFGQRTWFLYAQRASDISGVLPLAEVRSRLFGHKLVSLPFCVYGGIAADDEPSRTGLLKEARQLARRLGVDFLELRHRQASGVQLPTSDRYVTFRKALDPDVEANLNAVPRKQRAMIRKGAAKGLRARFDLPVAGFYRVYAESLRNLGTPVLPLRYFQSLQRVFGPACEITGVGLDTGAPAAAVMSFYFRDEVLPYYGGGGESARDLHAYDFMYWELLAHALGKGVRVYDFGRSRQGTGSYRFKTHWGFEPEPLQYQYDLVKAREMPNVTPDNPRYRRMIELWQKLPVPVTTLIGPWLARSLG